MESFDFVVVGGGIAGAAAAYRLADHGSVVVLEREATCGYHSSGRSAAVFTECYGLGTGRRLAIAGRSFLEDPPEGFTEHPLVSPRPLLFVAREDQMPALQAAYEEAAVLVPSARVLDAAGVRRMCPLLRPDYVAGGMLEPGAMDIDVHALHYGFLRGARRRGALVRTEAPVEQLQQRDSGWLIGAGGLRLAGGVVVNAAGAWCDLVAGLAGAAPLELVPMRRTVFTFEPPPGTDHRNWPMVVDVDERFYLKPEGPHLLASPADETPMEPVDVRHDELDVAVAIDRVQAAFDLEIRHVKRAWAGLRSFVADRSPVAGMDPDVPGFFWLAGQGGVGIKTSPAMGEAAAELITKGRLPATLRKAGLAAGDLAPERLRPPDPGP